MDLFNNKFYYAKFHRVHLQLLSSKMIARVRFHHFYRIIIFYNNFFQDLSLKSYIRFILAILEFHILIKLMKSYQKI